MALGTITQLNLDPSLSASEPGVQHLGACKITLNQLAGESSYATGGSSLTPAQLGFGAEGVILWADVQISASSGSNDGAVQAYYNTSTNKLQMFVTSGTSPVGLAEAAPAANLSGLTITILAIGYPGV